MIHRRTALVAIGAANAFVAALAVPAPAGPIAYYTAPKMLKQGTSSSPIPATAKIVVQVLVNADGSFKGEKIISSTNHADDAAALEIVKTSKYAPAKRGSTKVVGFYDFTLNFKVNGAVSGPTDELSKYEAQLHDAKYADAQAALKGYVASHPSDTRAQLDLGIADTYLNDFSGGSAAFDKAGSIPSGDKAVATKAYVSYAVALLNSKDDANGLVAAKHAEEFAPGFVSEDTLGYAQLQSGDAASAVASLEKAHALAASDAAATPTSRVDNDVHLVQAYLANGDPANAQKIVAEANGIDPKSASKFAATMASFYATKAQDAAKSGKTADSAALYVQAADADPSQGVVLYANACFEYLKSTPPANDKAKDAADRALAVDANSALANYAEGVTLAHLGKDDDAKASLNKAETLAKASGGNATLVPQIESALKQLSVLPGS